MFLVESIKSAGQQDYLLDTEDKFSRAERLRMEEMATNLDDFPKFLKDNNLKQTEEAFERYLNNGQTHYGARVSNSIKEVFGEDTRYSRELYMKLMRGEAPTTIKPEFKHLIKNDNGDLIRKNDNQKIGVDTCATAPKGVSALFAIADKDTRDKLANAMFETYEQQLKEISKQINPSTQRAEYRDFDPTQTKLFATTFLHQDTRPDEQNKAGLSKEELLKTVDPHLHLHGHISNVAMFAFYKRDDKGEIILKGNGKPDYEYKMLAIDNQNLFKNQIANSAQFDCMLNSNIQKAGLKTVPDTITNEKTGEITNSFTFEGIDRLQIEKLSNRSKSIYEDLKNYKKDIRNEVKLRQHIGKESKTAKIEDITAEELEKAIRTNTVEVLGSKNLNNILENAKHSKQFQSNVSPNIFYEDKNINTAGYIKPNDIKTTLYRELMFERTFDSMADLDKAVEEKLTYFANQKEHGLNALMPITNDKGEVIYYTKLSNALQERSYIDTLKKLATNTQDRTQEQITKDKAIFDNFVSQAKDKGFVYNEGQLRAMEQSLQLGYEGGKVLSTVGDPGSGKTSSLIKFQVELWNKRNGRGKVYGVSTANVATKALAEAGIPDYKLKNSSKLLSEAYEKNEETGEYKLKASFINNPKNKNNLYIFDEYGMAGAEHGALLNKLAIATNSSISFVGDPKQLASVSYGTPMIVANKELEKINPNTVQHLEKIMRQKNYRALEIVNCYKDSRVEDLFNLLENEKALTVAKTEKTLLKEVATDYLNDKASISEKIITCGKNDTIDKLNQAIRDKIKKEDLEPNIQFKNEVKINVSRPASKGTISRDLDFAVGERIVFLEGFKQIDPATRKAVKGGWQLDNSQLAIIKNIEQIPDSKYYNITVNADGKEITFSTEQSNSFSHSYCVSTWKGQGASKLHSYHVGNADTKNQAFVAGSRHTGTKDILDDKGNIIEKGELGYKLYLAEKDIDKFKKSITREQVKYSTLGDTNLDQAVNDFANGTVKKQLTKAVAMPKMLVEKLTDKLQLIKSATQSNQAVVDRKQAEIMKQEQLAKQREEDKARKELEEIARQKEEENRILAEKQKEIIKLRSKLVIYNLYDDQSLIDDRGELYEYLDKKHTIYSKHSLYENSTNWLQCDLKAISAIVYSSKEYEPNIMEYITEEAKEMLEDLGIIKEGQQTLTAQDLQDYETRKSELTPELKEAQELAESIANQYNQPQLKPKGKVLKMKM